MPNKIESAIRKLLKKNQSAAEKGQKKRKMLKGVAGPDSTVTDEEALEREMKRREHFARKKLPNVLKNKKK